MSLLTGQLDKVDAATNRVRRYTYNGPSNHLALQSSVVDPNPTLVPSASLGGTWTTPAKTGALNLVTSFAFDPIGNPTQINGPRTDVTDITNYLFDQDRRLTTVTRLLAGANYAVTRYCYDVDGEFKSTNVARAAGANDPNANTAAMTGQCPQNSYAPGTWQTEARDYYPTGDLSRVTDAKGNVTRTLYDALSRPVVLTDAELRQTATVYDAAGQKLCIWRGGTSWTATTSLGCSWTSSVYADDGALRYAAYTYSDDQKLSKGEIDKLIAGREDPEELKGGKATGQRDLFKDKKGNIYVKPKDGRGPGDPTGLNIKNF